MNKKTGGRKMKKLTVLGAVVLAVSFVSCNMAMAVRIEPVEEIYKMDVGVAPNGLKTEISSVLKEILGKEGINETMVLHSIKEIIFNLPEDKIVLAYAESLQGAINDTIQLGEINDFINDLKSGDLEIRGISINVITPEQIEMGVAPYLAVTIYGRESDNNLSYLPDSRFQVLYDISGMDEELMVALGELSGKEFVSPATLALVSKLLEHEGSRVYRVNYMSAEDLSKTIDN